MSDIDPWPGHVLVITGNEEIDREYDIECPAITDACRSWLDCDTCTADDRAALHEVDRPIAHGVEHRLFSWGWSVPSGQCFVRDNAGVADAAQDVDRLRLAPGRYPVEFEVDDETDLILRLAAAESPGGTR